VNLQQWAERWGIPPQAFAELAACSIVEPDPDALVGGKSEAFVQSLIRLEAARTFEAVSCDVAVQVEQQHGNAGVAEVCSDLRPHRARSKNGDRPNQ